MKKEFVFKQFDNGNALAGMTLKSAGNFYANGSMEGVFGKADKVFQIAGFSRWLGNVIMRAEGHGSNVYFFEKLKKGESAQVFCDGVIYRGAGAAVFFPGGCPAIAFHDRKAGISGMLHGGWKSIAQGVVKNFLCQWKNIGGLPDTTQIEFLPAICGNCLIFDIDYFKKVSAAMVPINASMFARKISKKYIGLDLPKLIEVSISELGYSAKNNATCVCCSGNHWCYRCDDKNGKKYRNAAFIISG